MKRIVDIEVEITAVVTNTIEKRVKGEVAKEVEKTRNGGIEVKAKNEGTKAVDMMRNEDVQSEKTIDQKVKKEKGMVEKTEKIGIEGLMEISDETPMGRRKDIVLVIEMRYITNKNIIGTSGVIETKILRGALHSRDRENLILNWGKQSRIQSAGI